MLKWIKEKAQEHRSNHSLFGSVTAADVFFLFVFSYQHWLFLHALLMAARILAGIMSKRKKALKAF